MKAIIINEFGTSEVLTSIDCPKPTICEGEVLIRTTNTKVNFADIKNRTGNKAKANFPMVLGLDVAGVIEEVFNDSSGFQKGDQVIAFPKNGAYAEFVVAKEQLVFKIPSGVPIEKVSDCTDCFIFIIYVNTSNSDHWSAGCRPNSCQFLVG